MCVSLSSPILRRKSRRAFQVRYSNPKMLWTCNDTNSIHRYILECPVTRCRCRFYDWLSLSWMLPTWASPCGFGCRCRPVSYWKGSVFAWTLQRFQRAGTNTVSRTESFRFEWCLLISCQRLKRSEARTRHGIFLIPRTYSWSFVRFFWGVCWKAGFVVFW